jgi:hypothetical protein
VSTIGKLVTAKTVLTWPAYGQWEAEVSTLTGVVPHGLVTIKIADVSFVGTVLPGRSGVDGPEAWRGIVRAGAGWNTKLTELNASYGGGPVKLSTVLAHVAEACGETIVQPTDVIIGSSFSRPVSLPMLPFRGRDLLALLRDRGITGPWRVDLDGVTRWGVRPAPTVPEKSYTRLPSDLSAGYRKVSVTSLRGIVPGAILDGAKIGRLVITEDAGALTCETYER